MWKVSGHGSEMILDAIPHEANVGLGTVEQVPEAVPMIGLFYRPEDAGLMKVLADHLMESDRGPELYLWDLEAVQPEFAFCIDLTNPPDDLVAKLDANSRVGKVRGGMSCKRLRAVGGANVPAEGVREFLSSFERHKSAVVAFCLAQPADRRSIVPFANCIAQTVRHEAFALNPLE